MQVLINSDRQVDMNEAAVAHWQEKIGQALNRFSSWITRVEIHLTDENSKAKGGADDIRCLMEARPANQSPVTIEVRARNVVQAMSEGTQTLEKRLATIQEKARAQSRKSQA